MFCDWPSQPGDPRLASSDWGLKSEMMTAFIHVTMVGLVKMGEEEKGAFL